MKITSLIDKNFILSGWFVVWLSFMLQGLANGTTHYLIGVFIIPLAEYFKTTMTNVLFATSSVLMVVSALISPLVGFLMQSYKIKSILLLGTVAMGLGFIALSNANSILQIALISGSFIAIGLVILNIGTNTLISNWFSFKRGRALGFSAAGMSMFGFILPPLITYSIKYFDWRIAYAILSAPFFFMLPIIILLGPDNPKKTDVLKGGPEGKLETDGAELDGRFQIFRRSLKHPKFLLVVTIVSLTMGISVSLMANIVSISSGKGFSFEQAAWLASITAMFALVGKIGFGVMSDNITQRMMACVPAQLLVLSCILLMQNTYIFLALACIILGLAIGAATPAWSLLISLNFDRGSFSVIMGLMSPFIALIISIMVPIISFFDHILRVDNVGLYFFIALALFVVKLGASKFQN